MIQVFCCARYLRIVLSSAALLLVAATAASAQRSFGTPDEAAAALAEAATYGDDQRVLPVLGGGSEDIVSSGDKVEDADTLHRFAAAYDAKHELATDGDKTFLIL